MEHKVKDLQNEHTAWVREIFIKEWGGDFIVSRGRIHRPEELRGFVAETENGERVGLLTFKISDQELEIVSLNSFWQGKGVGTSLIEAVLDLAKRENIKRIYSITTNDNLCALRFYQKRNFKLSKIHSNALEATRKLKPTLPEIGEDGIPLRDEIELEIYLT